MLRNLVGLVVVSASLVFASAALAQPAAQPVPPGAAENEASPSDARLPVTKPEQAPVQAPAVKAGCETVCVTTCCRRHRHHRRHRCR